MIGGENMQNSVFMSVDEVANVLCVSKSSAYKLIQRLNKEMSQKGYITISGRINREYFFERVYRSGGE